MADMLIAPGAIETVPARADQGNHDMIARFHCRDPGADYIDHSRRLVPIHRGDLTAPATVHENDVTVTNGAGRKLDLDLAGLGCIEFDCFDNQWFAVLSAYSCFHIQNLPRLRRS